MDATAFVAPQDVKLDFKFGLQNWFDFDNASRSV